MINLSLSRDFNLSITNPSESTEGFKIEVYSEILSRYNRVIASVCFDKKQTKQVPLSFMDGVSQDIFISDIYGYELSKSIDIYCICCNNVPLYDDISSNTVEIEIPPKKDAILIYKEFNENGDYKASDDNADGYSDIRINVPDQSKDILNSLIDRSITTITSDATSIGSYAFNGCSALTEVDFPNATSIEGSAFYGCAALTEINFPNVISIGESAFRNCATLTEVNFPNVTSIGSYAFNGCSALIEANFLNMKSVPSRTFYGCAALTKVNFPNVKSIEQTAFFGCKALTEVNFPNVTSIGSSAFSNCQALTEVNFPNVVSIGNNAFANCTGLKYFDMREVERVPSISTSTFSGTICYFIFRDQTQLDEYASATNWSALADRFII